MAQINCPNHPRLSIHLANSSTGETVKARPTIIIQSTSGRLAVSLASRSHYRFETAARVAVKMARTILEEGLPEDIFLNINVPNLEEKEIKSYKITRQGRWIHSENAVVEKVDPRGRKYYWIGGGEWIFDQRKDTDFGAVSNSHISVTPLRLDLTNYVSIRELKEWKF